MRLTEGNLAAVSDWKYDLVPPTSSLRLTTVPLLVAAVAPGEPADASTPIPAGDSGQPFISDHAIIRMRVSAAAAHSVKMPT